MWSCVICKINGKINWLNVQVHKLSKYLVENGYGKEKKCSPHRYCNLFHSKSINIVRSHKCYTHPKCTYPPFPTFRRFYAIELIETRV